MQEEADWATAKRVLGQPKFIERLMAYDADDTPDAVIEALQRVVTDPRFTADQVCTAMGAGWCMADQLALSVWSDCPMLLCHSGATTLSA